MAYHITKEDVQEALRREVPDSHKCLHEFHARPVGTVTPEGSFVMGLIARSVQHDAKGNLSVHDFVITPDVMEMIARELHASAQAMALVNQMSDLPGVRGEDLVSLLETLTDALTSSDVPSGDVPQPREKS